MEQKVKIPIHNYINGWYDKDPQLMKEGLHPLLAKRTPDNANANGVRLVDRDKLLEVTARYGGTKGSDRTMDITVFDIGNNCASAMAVSNEYVDYIQLVNYEGEWKIINVLWEYRSDSKTVTDDELKASLAKPAHDYVEGWYDKDKNRVGRGLHPDLAKRSLNAEGKIDGFTYQSLLDVVNLYGGGGGDTRRLDITIQDVGKSIASAKLVSNAFTDYVHLVKIDDEWRILNVLWYFNS